MRKFIKSVLSLLLISASAFSVEAYNSNDVYFFFVPRGYNLEKLSKTLGVEPDVICKYNPQAKDGIFTGMRLYVPAAAVSEDGLRKVDPAPVFAGGALNSVYEYALSGGLNQTRPKYEPFYGSVEDDVISYPKQVPTKIKSVNTLKEFFSNSPKFKCDQTNVEIMLSYKASDGFVAYVDGKRFGKFEVDVRDDRPTMALIGLPWLMGYGPAPMLLSLNGDNTTLALQPVEGQETLSYNSQGYLQYGRTGNTNWMELSLSSEGVSFMPVDYKPDPEIFRFIGFTD